MVPSLSDWSGFASSILPLWESKLTLGDVLALIGELVVAWVIYREVSASRESTFLTEVDDQTYKNRPRIYEQFVEASGETAVEKAQAFAATIRNTPDLRIRIEEQMVVFSRAFVLLRSFWFRPNLMLGNSSGGVRPA